MLSPSFVDPKNCKLLLKPFQYKFIHEAPYSYPMVIWDIKDRLHDINLDDLKRLDDTIPYINDHIAKNVYRINNLNNKETFFKELKDFKELLKLYNAAAPKSYN